MAKDDLVYAALAGIQHVKNGMGKTPRINGTTRTWEVWDLDTNTYVDSGVSVDANLLIDDTLTQTGYAADAKVTGDKLGELKSDFGIIATYPNINFLNVQWESGIIDTDGEEQENDVYVRTDYIDLDSTYVEYLYSKLTTPVSILIAGYSTNDVSGFVGRTSIPVTGLYDYTPVDSARYLRFSIPKVYVDGVKIGRALDFVDVDDLARENIGVNTRANSDKVEYLARWTNGGLDNSTGGYRYLHNQNITDYIPTEEIQGIKNIGDSSIQVSVYRYDNSKTFVSKVAHTLTAGEYINIHGTAIGYYRFMALASAVNSVQLLSNPAWVNYEKTKPQNGALLNMSPRCIHHDNFYRDMTDGSPAWSMGKNNSTASVDNSYVDITGTTDDGFRVNMGLTAPRDTSRTVKYSFRRIYAEHDKNFMVEFSAPTATSQSIIIGYKVTSNTYFNAIQIIRQSSRYDINNIAVSGDVIVEQTEKKIYGINGYVFQMYFTPSTVDIYMDGMYLCSHELPEIGQYIAIGAYKSYAMALSFFNVFNLVSPTTYNSAIYLIDNNESTLPFSVVQANTDRYSLSTEETRFSNRSEKFILYSDDPKISNGRRTERSYYNLSKSNLRDIRYEFDVFFPSDVDDDTSGNGDIFFQLHDSISRSKVPFALVLVTDKVFLESYSSPIPEGESLTEQYSGIVSSVTKGEWMHVEVYVHERYEENQHPFMSVKINGSTVFESRKPNCPNDLIGTYAKYGEYKNTWDAITMSYRYIDNFRVSW